MSEAIRIFMDDAFDMLKASPMIPSIELTDRIKYGLYAIMKGYGLQFKAFERADWQWVELCDGENGNGLMAEEIKARDFDKIAFENACADIREMMRQANEKKDAISESIDQNGKPQYGWVTPMGEFIISPWGTHETAAERIIDENDWGSDYYEKLNADPSKNPSCVSAGDYLTSVKHYILIHAPDQNNIATMGKFATRRQREFLYDYFERLGDTEKAAEYLKIE